METLNNVGMCKRYGVSDAFTVKLSSTIGLNAPSSSEYLLVGTPIFSKLRSTLVRRFPVLVSIGTIFVKLLQMSMTTKAYLGSLFLLGILTPGSLAKPTDWGGVRIRTSILPNLSVGLLRHKVCSHRLALLGCPFPSRV